MKARLAKKILKNLSVLHLEPGDVLMVQTSGMVSMSTRERVREEVGQFFPGHKVLVVAGWDLAAVRPAEPGTLRFVGSDGVVEDRRLQDQEIARLGVPPSVGAPVRTIDGEE